MPTASDPSPLTLGTALPHVFEDDIGALLDAEAELTCRGDETGARALVRLGLQQPERTTRWYQSLLNRWEVLGRPALRPNHVEKTVAILSNHTVDNLAPLLTAFSASMGVHITPRIGDYDSVEPDALNPAAALHRDPSDFIVVVLSDHWLRRYTGPGGLVQTSDLELALDALRRITSALLRNGPSQILITTIPAGRIAHPGSVLHSEHAIGWTAAVNRLNLELHAMQCERLAVVDQAQAIHAAGGARASNAAYFARAKIPYDADGSMALAREIASAIVSLCGRSHRALVTDLDNTLWGGVIGDLGVHGVTTGQDDPDGLGYHQLQEYLKGLRSLGVLLAVSSKNSPNIADTFDGNPDIALERADFSSLQINWEPKSRAIARISADFGFGAEYMLFVDDNPFELAEALEQHPMLDVVLAQDDPVDTLTHLSAARFFNCVRITGADLDRPQLIAAKLASAEYELKFDDYDAYLKAIDMRITSLPFGNMTRSRVVQLFQKTNQFNLTTRRYTDAELDDLVDGGATVGVFAYEDRFGPQGIISTLVLEPDGNDLRIANWVMSCRVLNRTVEHAIFEWVATQSRGRAILANYVETEKNDPVRELYGRLGFRSDDGRTWSFDSEAGDAAPESIGTLIIATEGNSP